MAKRRKLEAPSSAELSEMQAEVAGRRPDRPAPIAQVAADASAFAPVSDPKDIADAAELRAAKGQGRLITALPIEAVNDMAMVRDRVVLDAGELEELKRSIAASGVRLPIEVFALDAPDGAYTHGLISGYRRLLAVRALYEQTEAEVFATIPALVVEKGDGAGAMARMVEENEVRAALTPFERGRIAVLAANQGLFANTQAAVDGLFPVASKAKRSKIRSFATVFEELGDLLVFGDQMQERQGLRLATALRETPEGALRNALEEAPEPASFTDEWAVLEPILERSERANADRPKPKGGRPKSKPPIGWSGDTLHLASGFALTLQSDGSDQIIRIHGRNADKVIGEAALMAIKSVLDAP